MNDSNKKAKPAEEQGRKPIAPDPRVSSDFDVDQKLKQLQVNWSEVISDLQSETFSSMEEAVNSVIDKAMRSVGLEGDEQVKESLNTVFQTDPALIEVLQSSLNIKG